MLVLCLPAQADELSIAAPWAGSLIVTPKAETKTERKPTPLEAAKIVPQLSVSAHIPNISALTASPPAKPPQPVPVVRGNSVLPKVSAGKRHVSIGFASYYRTGRVTANGERFLPLGMTAAHRTLPFGTKVLVTYKKTGKSVLVRINDRGPFVKNRSIDLTAGAARAIGLDQAGVASVEMELQ